MPRLNGTVKWIPILVSVALGTFIVADKLGSPAATKVAACEKAIEGHALRLTAVETDTACVKTELTYIKDALRRIERKLDE